MLKKQARDVVEEARDGVYHSFSARAVRRNCKQFTAIVVAGTYVQDKQPSELGAIGTPQ
jgi:hypothetical protein